MAKSFSLDEIESHVNAVYAEAREVIAALGERSRMEAIDRLRKVLEESDAAVSTFHPATHTQDQRSTTDQLCALYALANRNGLYDAADYVQTIRKSLGNQRITQAKAAAAAPAYDPAKVRELVAAALVVAEADAKSELDGIMIEEMARAAQALRDGEGE